MRRHSATVGTINEEEASVDCDDGLRVAIEQSELVARVARSWTEFVFVAGLAVTVSLLSEKLSKLVWDATDTSTRTCAGVS